MRIECLYTTRKTQKNKRWQDGFLQLGSDMRSFQLLSQEDEILTSGLLRNEIHQCIEENEENYEFENREYLIMVERASLSMSDTTAPNIPEKVTNSNELIQPRGKKEMGEVDLMSLLQPKKLKKGIQMSDIDSLLGCMTVKKVAVETSLETKNSVDLHASNTSLLHNLSLRSRKPENGQTQSSLNKSDPVFASEVSKDLSLSMPSKRISSDGPSSSRSASLHPSVHALATVLPTFDDIQSKNYSFFTQSLSLQSFSSVQQYETFQMVAMNTLIRHTIYQALAQLYQHAKIKNLNASNLKSISVPKMMNFSIWEDCTLRVKSDGNKDCCRYYLIVPGLSRRKDEADESFFNHLLIVPGTTPSFLQVLWHGCTSSDLIEVKPWNIDTVKSQISIKSFEKRTVIDVGSIDMEIRCLEVLPQLQQHHLACALLQPVSSTRCQNPFSSIVLRLARERLQSLFAFNEDQQNVVDSVLHFFDETQSSAPLQLIQGVFGSGKSLLIASLLILIYSLQQVRRVVLEGDETPDILGLSEDTLVVESLRSQETPIPSLSVLFCSHTNVAVDRVCLLLQQYGLKQFRRAGNLRRIHPAIRPMYNQQETAVVCSTICGLPTDGEHTVVIVDEASQVYEHYSLLPVLIANPQLLLLVGDPNQLPPVPIEHIPQLSQSLFQRLLPLYPVQLLRTQYRCHPSIADLASKLFYESRLLNASITNSRPKPLPSYPRILFIDITSPERAQGESYMNPGEATVIQRLVNEVMSSDVSIGVISLYLAQCHVLTRCITNPQVQISTVDAFQGSEKDIIILSTVRSRSIGFTADPKRLNVAITRARAQLVILGNRLLLESNPLWMQILKYVDEQQ